MCILLNFLEWDQNVRINYRKDDQPFAKRAQLLKASFEENRSTTIVNHPVTVLNLNPPHPILSQLGDKTPLRGHILPRKKKLIIQEKHFYVFLSPHFKVKI